MTPLFEFLYEALWICVVTASTAVVMTYGPWASDRFGLRSLWWSRSRPSWKIAKAISRNPNPLPRSQVVPPLWRSHASRTGEHNPSSGGGPRFGTLSGRVTPVSGGGGGYFDRDERSGLTTAKARRSMLQRRTVFLRDLSFWANENHLYEFVSAVVTPEDWIVCRDQSSGKSKGFGFVQCTSDREAARVIERLDGRTLCGRAVRIESSVREITRSKDSLPPPIASPQTHPYLSPISPLCPLPFTSPRAPHPQPSSRDLDLTKVTTSGGGSETSSASTTAGVAAGSFSAGEDAVEGLSQGAGSMSLSGLELALPPPGLTMPGEVVSVW